MLGNPAAPVTMVVFSDFQCPFCRGLATTLRDLVQSNPNVNLVFAHRPLPMHPDADAAALIAAAAHRQGKFWAVHDLWMEMGGAVTRDRMLAASKEAGVDPGQFGVDLQDPALSHEVEHQKRVADAVNADGTPTSFVNGEALSGNQPAGRFLAAIERATQNYERARLSGLRGEALRLAAWTAGSADAGPKLLRYLRQGVHVPATAATAERVAAPVANDERVAAPAKAPAVVATADLEVWKVPVDPKRDAVLGDSKNAVVTWVIFSDIECPYCQRLHQVALDLVAQSGGLLRLVWKHMPLPFHGRAQPAHLAALAAGRQGAFWPYIQRCFAIAEDDDAPRIDEAALVKHAQALNLDLARFARDRANKALLKQVQADMALAKRLGVEGTPTSFLNGRLVKGAQNVGLLQAQIAALAHDPAARPGHAAYNAQIARGRVSPAPTR